MVHLVTASEPIIVAVAGFDDFSDIESAWWRLVEDQQQQDFRGPIEELQSPLNIERVQRFLESKIRQSRILVAKEHGELAVSYTHLRAHETALHLVCRRVG